MIIFFIRRNQYLVVPISSWIIDIMKKKIGLFFFVFLETIILFFYFYRLVCNLLLDFMGLSADWKPYCLCPFETRSFGGAKVGILSASVFLICILLIIWDLFAVYPWDTKKRWESNNWVTFILLNSNWRRFIYFWSNSRLVFEVLLAFILLAQHPHEI